MKERTGAAIVAVDVREIIVGINIESAIVKNDLVEILKI